MIAFAVLLISTIGCANAFLSLPPTRGAALRLQQSKLNVVRFDKTTERWETDSPETEGPSGGYNIAGSLFRAGPLPVFQRIINGDAYEQGVLKYIAGEGCGRVEAQGNFDACLENPN